ncbi:TPA: Ada metal-binding domain-containing protein [Serratia marcescens]
MMHLDANGGVNMLTQDKTFTLLGPNGKPYSSATPGIFGGHRGGKLYGRLDCRAARSAIARGGYVKHRVFFADEATAIAAGYRPCAVCMPQEYAVWKKTQSIKTKKEACL